jgi:uncharacterized protein YhaN
MRLDRIHLENFGIYTRQKFQFDSAPLILIYGPNESGKTTALNGLRSAMFGFPSRSAYLTGKPMAAEVAGRLADGTEFEFTRRKARKDELAGKIGKRRIAGEELTAIFGEMDLDSYQQLFGFSLEELRNGETALKNAKLSEALAGGGMGGAAALQLLRSELGNSVTSLFRTRGSSRISSLLGDIRTRQEELKGLQVLPFEVEELRNQLLAAIQGGEEAKATYVDLHQRLTRAERLQQAFPKLQEMRRIDQTLQSMDIPAGVDATFIGQWGDFLQQHSNLVQTIQEERQRLEHDQRTIAKLQGNGYAAEHESRIELIGHQAAGVPNLREQLVETLRQYTEAQSGYMRALETLGIEQPSSALLNLTISIPQRSEIESWVVEYDKLCKDLLSINAKLESNAEQLTQFTDAGSCVESLSNTEELLKLIEEISQAERLHQQLVDSISQKSESPDFAILASRLPARLSECPVLDYSWPVPTLEDVARHLRRSDEVQRNIAQKRREVQQIDAALTLSKRELEELESNNEQSSWGELKNLSRQRDQLIEGWIDELSEPLIACSITPDQQKLRLQQLKVLSDRADGLIESLVESAETLAKVNHAKKQIRDLQEQRDAACWQLDQEVTSQDALTQQWIEAWRNCPFQPLAPDLMSSWVSDFAAWSSVAAEIEIERRKLKASTELLKELRRELMDLWPASLSSDAPMTSLRDQLITWEQNAKQYQNQTARKASMQAAMEELQQRQSAILAGRDSIVNLFETWLSANELPGDWPITQTPLLLESVERLKRDYRTATQAEKQIEELKQRIASFDSGVAELIKLLGEKEGELPAEILAQRWLASLQGARKVAADRARLSASIEHRTNRIAELDSRLQDVELRLNTLAASIDSSAGIQDRTKLNALMQRAQQAADLRTTRNELMSALEIMAGSESLEQFLKTLGEMDDARIAVEIEEIKRSLANYEALRQQADQQVGALNSRLEQLAKNDAAQRAQHQLHAQRGELAELAEQWVVGRLAQELLSRCIERFTHDHEPALLQLTHKFLDKLTGGRYVAVEHDRNSSGTFIVRNARDEAVEPDKLSTGTREQLYLAIRMAFITHYTQHHEPLPVLMDDCFVNFDDARTRLALQTLLNWNGAVQTILLSCHGRIVHQIADLAPDTPVICLDRNATYCARDLVDESTIAAT